MIDGDRYMMTSFINEFTNHLFSGFQVEVPDAYICDVFQSNVTHGHIMFIQKCSVTKMFLSIPVCTHRHIDCSNVVQCIDTFIQIGLYTHRVLVVRCLNAQRHPDDYIVLANQFLNIGQSGGCCQGS